MSQLVCYQCKRCENCNALFKPGRDWARFCSENCRKEFHRYGSSYGPLKTGLHKAIDKKYAELRKEVKTELGALSMRLVRLEQRLLVVERSQAPSKTYVE